MADVDQAPSKSKRNRAGSSAASIAGDAVIGVTNGDKTGESGDRSSTEAGDKSGEFTRREFTLDEQQREALADAKGDDRKTGDGAKTGQEAFWRAAGDRMGFNPVTVEESDDIGQSGRFTAYPADNTVARGTGDLHGMHERAIDRMENIASEAQFETRTLVFDLRDTLLDIFKTRPKPWSAYSQDEQRDVAAAAENIAKDLIRKIVETVAADGRTNVRALLVKYDEGDDIKVTLKVKAFTPEETEAAIIGLHRARGKHVLITVASADDYHEGNREAETQPDQPGLGFEAGTDERPADDRDLAGEDEPVIHGDTGMAEVVVDGVKTERPATLEELTEAHGGTFRTNVQTGMIEYQPTGVDSERWEDVRAATPEELAAERERVADFKE